MHASQIVVQLEKLIVTNTLAFFSNKSKNIMTLKPALFHVFVSRLLFFVIFAFVLFFHHCLPSRRFLSLSLPFSTYPNLSHLHTHTHKHTHTHTHTQDFLFKLIILFPLSDHPLHQTNIFKPKNLFLFMRKMMFRKFIF